MPHPKLLGSFFYKFYTYSTLTLKQLAAITPPDHEVEIIDEKFKKINFSSLYDLVGISSITCNAPRAYEVADEFHRCLHRFIIRPEVTIIVERKRFPDILFIHLELFREDMFDTFSRFL